MKDDRLYLLHIRDACKSILEYSQEGEGFFRKDRKTQDATIRNLEIIGEASYLISEETKKAFTQIPWSEMKAMRNKLIHNYFGVKLDLVWETISKDIPKLQSDIEALVEKLGGEKIE